MAKEKETMMGNYKKLKENYPDTIILYRLGDFYEMFYDDAKIASKVLDLTLTGRSCGDNMRAPMCGVPYHAVDNYIGKLLSAGYKVGICEQLTKPGDQKGILKRDIVRIITAGTNTGDDTVDSKENHYLCAIARLKGKSAVALLDITTGEFSVKTFATDLLESLEDYLLSNRPSEIIATQHTCDEARTLLSVTSARLVRFTPHYDYSFDYDSAAKTLCRKFSVYDVEALGLKGYDVAVCAAGAAIDYVFNTQKRNLDHINKVEMVSDEDYMHIDYNTRRNLELTESILDGKKTGSLIGILDRTKTAMGARLLRNWILKPLQKIPEIEARQKAVAELFQNAVLRSAVGNNLSQIKDIERLVTKISYGSILPRDCIALRESLRIIPEIKKFLSRTKSQLLGYIDENLNELTEIVEKLDRAIADDAQVFKDGGYIKDKYSDELDKLRDMKNGGQELLRDFEQSQRAITGINALKVANNRVFGYFIEIPNSKIPETLPAGYTRKQTIANAERYVNDELLRLESDILGASERAIVLESELFDKLREFLAKYTHILQRNARLLAILDALYSLAQVAFDNDYVCPRFFKNSYKLYIVDGRHPVVEILLKKNEFVSNDTELSDKSSSLIILTGPNMAGKSTYIRQIAVLTLMAHIGSFVPAVKMELGVVDKIFTRVGASDNIIRGQSTFMVEMLEVANILNNATDRSLLILDEIGRGTSTLDGLSIAWAVVEHIVTKIKAKTLFATHYHELCELEKLLPGIKNYRILVKESEEGIVFLYKVSRGGANKSFGIEVAGIAGIKKSVTERAEEILNALSQNHVLAGNLPETLSDNISSHTVACNQLSFFPEDERFTELKNILNDTDINRCTPIEALTILSDMKKIIKNK